MGLYEKHILPRLVHFALDRPRIRALREAALAGATGKVVELGFGSGLNLPHYPDGVTEVHAIDPDTTGRKLAGRYLARSPIPVTFAGLDGESLPLASASLDTAVSTFTLCSIPDVRKALTEARRVLRPGGRFHFLEHGLSPDARVARWQHRLTPLQQRVAGGCRLNRKMDSLLVEAGFVLDSLETFYLMRPRFATFLYRGVAVRSRD